MDKTNGPQTKRCEQKGIKFEHAQFTVALCGSRYRMQWDCPKVSGMCVNVMGG